MTPSRHRLPDIAAYAALLGAWLIHCGYIFTYSVNVPYRDEWGLLGPDGLPAGLSLRWLFGVWNEHRIVLTKLQIWALYHLDGWNLTTHHLLNFVIYGGLVVLAVELCSRAAPATPRWVFTLFGIFLLSPLAQENHLMGFQSQFHFALLFFLAAVLSLFVDNLAWPRLCGGAACAVLAAYSFASGVVLVAVLTSVFAVWKLLRFRAAQQRVDLQQGAACLVVLSAALALWFVGYARSAHGFATPLGGLFWTYFFNLLSSGLGHSGLSPLPGVLYLLFILTPIVMLLRRENSPQAWSTLAVLLGLLAALAMIAVGRAVDFGIAQSKASRYTEFTLLLIPFSAAAWAQCLAARPVAHRALLSMWAVVCLVMVGPTWRELPGYVVQYEVRSAGCHCAASYYAGTGRGNCMALYPDNMVRYLDGAKKLDLSFYRELQKQPAP